jgi:predicted oxidoreductase (fatty acid repression mutant protein)
MARDLAAILAERHSIYAIGNKIPVSDDKVVELVKRVVAAVPSAYNSQSQKVVILFGDDHKKVWDITRETLRKIVPEDKFARTNAKMDSFEAGHGTILFFDDRDITEDFETKFPSYKDNFEVWAQQANGMLQLAIWASLEDIDIGASLQHYNPLIDDEIKTTFNLPKNRQLIAEMPFGEILGCPDEKPKLPIEKRVIVK